MTHQTGQLDELDFRLRALGSVGWEAVGYCSIDRTIGLNVVSVLLKRPTVGLALPADGEPAGWLPDPAGRFARRYWDGLRWSEHVADEAGVRDTDWPNVRV